MKNPWKQISKISPQVEDGYCRMNNEILQKLISHKLTGSQLSIVLYIWRKTWGFNKKEDAISISQFINATRLSGRGIQKTVRELKRLRIIYFEQRGPLNNGSPLNVYLFNKHWDTWKVKPLNRRSPLNKQVPDPRTVVHPPPEQTGIPPLNRRSPTKDIITKDNIQKTLLQKTKKKKDIIQFVEIIKDLNKKAEKNFAIEPKKSSKAFVLVSSRIKEGFTKEDFFKVHTVKCYQWKNDEKMKPYLRPSTLYGVSKFGEYLAEYKDNNKKSFTFTDLSKEWGFE